MLKERVVTAIIMALVVLAILFLAPPQVFFIACVIVFIVASWEWANLSGFSGAASIVSIGAFTGVMLGVVYILGGPQKLNIKYLDMIFTLASGWWAVAFLWVKSFPASTVIWRTTAVRYLLSFLVLLPAFLSLIWMHSLDNGIVYIVLAVGLVAAADIGAYAFGRLFGKKKLAPAVSPGKSWAGLWGGLFCGVILASAVMWYGQVPQSMWLKNIILTVLIVLASVVGDLFESMLKRHRQIKDSSHILPGHGGVLDRLDGLSAGLPLFALALMHQG